ncbi:MAG: glycosyltransferase family 39 protein [Dehalococcoidia bacterium]
MAAAGTYEEPRRYAGTLAFSNATRPIPRVHVLVVVLCTLALGAAATAWSMAAGVADSYGDATHHLVIARRVVDSQTPGFAQFGTVWLPLPHIIFLPLVLIDPLFWTGLAGAIVGVVSLAIASVAVFLIAWSGTGRAVGGYVAVAVLITDPNMLYLQSSAMTEPLYMAVLALQAYMMVRWVRWQNVGDLLMLGVVTAVGVGTRYDGWFVAAAVTFAVVTVTVLRFRDQERATANGITVVAVSAFVVFLWLFYNWIIFGNPLEFSNGELAPATQAAQIGIDATKGNLIGSIYTYGTAMLEDLGPILLAFGGVVVVWAAITEAKTPILWGLLVLAAAAGFNVVSLFLGQSVIRTQYSDPQGVLNIRYGIQVLPVVAMSAGLVVGQLGSRLTRRIGVAVVVLVIAGQSALYISGGWTSIRTLVDAQPTRPGIAETTKAARWYRDHHVKGEVALFYSLATPESARFFMRAEVPIREYLTENNDVIWKAAFDRPHEYVDWLIVSPQLPGRADPVREVIDSGRSVGVNFRYELQAEVDGWQFYRRVPPRG